MFDDLFTWAVRPIDWAFAQRCQMSMIEHMRAEDAAAVAGPVDPQMVAVLRDAPLRVSDWANSMAPYYRAVSRCRAKGMVVGSWSGGAPEACGGSTTYSLTDEGRAELERQRIKDLAKIGVYEVLAH